MIWSAKEAAIATDGKIFSNWRGGKIVFDSRLIEKDDIFIALPGAKIDSHEFVADALRQGAAAAIVSKIPDNLENKDKLLLVNNCLQALNSMALYKRNRSQAKFIAVTGSVGKTSTKEQLKLAFEAHGKTFVSRGNYNNFLGVPINLASMPDDTEFAIFEIGMDHAGEIEPLSKMVKP
ncbi:MAG: Mur ligase family protein, partial [Pseudomonadota bacterium]